jgi:flagellar basal-body rod protein FlgB
MELFDTTSALLSRALDGASMRQETLAGNLANANTPNYQRKDVDFQGELRNAMQVGSADNVSSVQFQPTVDAQAMTADGNGVDVDNESAKLAQNGMVYQSLIGVMNGRLDILRAAIGNGQ